MPALRRGASWLILIAAAFGYVALRGAVGRSSHVDEIFYKAAGLHWAQGDGFRAPEETGCLGFDPGLEKVWAAYPPLYPFLFGVVVKLAGFGWRQCVLYDAAIHASLAFLAALVVRRQAPQLAKWAPPLAGLALLPLGTFGRPDELAICFAAGGFLALPIAGPSAWRLATAGAMFGLCAGTSLGAAATVAPVVLAAVLTAEWPSRRKIVAASVVIITGLLACAAIVAPLIYTHPEAPTQFLQHVHHHFTTTTWAEGMATSLTLGRSQFVMLLAWVVVGPATVMTCLRMGRGREWLRLWAGPLVGAVFLLVAQPANFTYYWFVAPWLLAAVLGTALWLPDAPIRLLVVTMTGGVYIATLVPALQDEVMLLTLPPGQTIEDGAATARRLVPPGSRVWCNSGWYALAEDRAVFDFWLDLSSVSAVDYVVVAGTGWGEPEAGNLITASRRELIERNFDLIWDGLWKREGWLPTHHGTMFPDEGYGFGVRVYRAKRLAEVSGPFRASGGPDVSKSLGEASRLP